MLSDQIRGCGVHRVVGIGIHWAAHAVLNVVDVGHLVERPAREKASWVGVGVGVGVTTCFGLKKRKGGGGEEEDGLEMERGLGIGEREQRGERGGKGKGWVEY